MGEHLESCTCVICDKLLGPRRCQIVSQTCPAIIPHRPTQRALYLASDPAAASEDPSAPVTPRGSSPRRGPRNIMAVARGRRPMRTGDSFANSTRRVHSNGSRCLGLDGAVCATRSASMPPLHCSEKFSKLDGQRRASVHASCESSDAPALNASRETFAASERLRPSLPPSTPDQSDMSKSSSIVANVSVRSSVPTPDAIESPLRRTSVTKKLPLSPSELIREELLGWVGKQPKAPFGERQERVPPGWRPHESQWRKKVYGDFDPKPRLHLPANKLAPSALPLLPVDLPVDPTHLSRFERQPTPAYGPHAATQELLPKTRFTRALRSTPVPSPSSSVPLISAHRVPTSSILPTPTPPSSVLYRAHSSRQYFTSHRRRLCRSNDGCCEADSPSDSEEDYIQANLTKHLPTPVGGRSDTLSRALEAKAREELKEQYAAHKLAQLERECNETRQLVAQGIKPQSLKDHIRLRGPILGRRAAGVSFAPIQPSSSWKALSNHPQLDPMPWRQSTRAGPKDSGEVHEVQVEVVVPCASPEV